MENVKIFFHEREKFSFFMEQDTMADNMKIELKRLDIQHATTFSITKSKFKSLNRDDRECEEKTDYFWNDCLDEMFYLRKGLCLFFTNNKLICYYAFIIFKDFKIPGMSIHKFACQLVQT